MHLKSIRLFFVFLLCALLAVPLAAQLPTQFPNPAQLTDLEACDPLANTVLPTGDGFVAAWIQSTPGFGLPSTHLRRFDAEGAALTPTLDAERLWTPAVHDAGDGALLNSEDRTTVRFFDARFEVQGEIEIEDRGPIQDFVALPDGSFLVVSSDSPFAQHFDATGPLPDFDLRSAFGDDNVFLVLGDELLHVFYGQAPTSPPSTAVGLQRRQLDGTPIGEPEILSLNAVILHFTVAADLRGRVYLAWAAGGSVNLLRLGPDGVPLGDPQEVASGFSVGNLELTTDAEGNVLVTFEDESPVPGGSIDSSLVLGWSVLADGSFAGPVRTIFEPDAEGGYPYVLNGRAALAAPGLAQVLVQAMAPDFRNPIECNTRGPLTSVPTPLAGERHLLLRHGRFRVEVDWQDPHNGGDGTGHAVPNTEDAGSFWFFTPDNKEIEVKVLDGRPVNGHFWVFAAGLSDVGYQIHVTDQRTGRTRTYVNPPTEFGNFIDTGSFSDEPLSVPDTLRAAPRPWAARVLASAVLPGLLEPGVFLNGAHACDPGDPSLARRPEGFVASYPSASRSFNPGSLRGFGPLRAALTDETALGVDVVTTAVATAPDGSGMVVYGDSTREELRAWPFGPDAEPTGAAPLTLGALPLDPAEPVELRLIRLDDGSYLMTDNIGPEAVRFTAGGVTDRFPVPGPDVVQVGGELWVAHFGGLVTSPPSARIGIDRLSLTGEVLGEVFSADEPLFIFDAELVTDALDRPTLAWTASGGVRVRRFATNGSQDGGTVTLFAGTEVEENEQLGEVEVAHDDEGNLLVTWRTDRFVPERPGRLMARALLEDDLLTGPPVVLLDGPADLSPERLELLGHDAVVSSAGIATVAAVYPGEGIEILDGCPADPSALLGIPQALGGERHLLLRDGRFRVEVDWQDPHNGGSGIGHAVPGTEDAGSFWFFDETNKEIEVKVLDGTTINGNFWVFAAGLSDVGYQIIVTDQRTGNTKTYTNPPLEFGNFIDTESFPGSNP